MELLKIIFAFTILMLIGACANQDSASSILPQETSETLSFVIDKTQSTSREEGQICVHISQEPFWREGFDEELTPHLVENITLVIDNNVISHSNLELIVTDAVYSVIEDDEVIGSYGGAISVCTITMGLSLGIHTAIIEVQDLSNRSHRYTWEFVVEE